MIQKRLEQGRFAEQARKMTLRSASVQLNLPRPIVTLELLQSLYSTEEDDIESMISKEKALLLQRDAIDTPMRVVILVQ